MDGDASRVSWDSKGYPVTSFLMASVKINRDLPPPELEPSEIYGSSGPVALKISTGGAGQSGLLKALALAFIE